ncbi:MAG: tetratricopeptide repeat protein [Bacteroidales bacterium]|nr:tetratricopeptide repeat protein [Bacteroidales bacterium]
MFGKRLQELLDAELIPEAITELETYLRENPDDDKACYVLGRLYWKTGEKSRALACYRSAVELNPDSPARHALELTSDIFNFFNPDLLNP